uniref:Orf1 n=1 Tax=Pseudomonas putida TaxID=303 RepID=A0A0S2PI93_PSEPU|nr:Orf1 [Pseudomonas putida]
MPAHAQAGSWGGLRFAAGRGRRPVAPFSVAQSEELAVLGLDLFVHVLDQTAPAQQVAAELFDELFEAGAPLRARRHLMCFGNGRADSQEVAHVQRHRLDQDVLVAFELVVLAREAVQSLADRGLALVATVGREERGQRGGNDRRLGQALHRGQLVEAARVVALQEDVEAMTRRREAHSDLTGQSRRRGRAPPAARRAAGAGPDASAGEAASRRHRAGQDRRHRARAEARRPPRLARAAAGGRRHRRCRHGLAAPCPGWEQPAAPAHSSRRSATPGRRRSGQPR